MWQNNAQIASIFSTQIDRGKMPWLNGSLAASWGKFWFIWFSTGWGIGTICIWNALLFHIYEFQKAVGFAGNFLGPFWWRMFLPHIHWFTKACSMGTTCLSTCNPASYSWIWLSDSATYSVYNIQHAHTLPGVNYRFASYDMHMWKCKPASYHLIPWIRLCVYRPANVDTAGG